MLRLPRAITTLPIRHHLPTLLPCLSILSLPLRRYSSHSGGKVDDTSTTTTSIHHVEHVHPPPSPPPPPPSSTTSKAHTSLKKQYMAKKDTVDIKRYSHLFANPRIKAIIDRIVRVDQAGEYGAAKIYDGQLAVLKNTKEGPLIQHMAEQEREHQATFNELIRHFRVRPTALTPFWNVAGFALGAIPAMFSKSAAMAVTVAVETVISEHYNDQLRQLHDEGLTEEDYEDLRKFIKKFRDDEMEHHDIGIEHEAEKMTMYPVFSSVVKAGVRGAIFLSSRI